MNGDHFSWISIYEVNEEQNSSPIVEEVEVNNLAHL